MSAPHAALSGSIVTGAASTRVELRHDTWDASVTNAAPVQLGAATLGGRPRAFTPDTINVTYLQVIDKANRHTSHGWRIHEIQLTGPWLPDPILGRVIEATERGTIRITSLRDAPEWAQDHAAANLPTAILLDIHDPIASNSDSFVARTGIGDGTATEYDYGTTTVYVSAPKCYTEAIHTVTIPSIRGAEPLTATATVSIDPHTLTIQHAWRTQTNDTDWTLNKIEVNGTIHQDQATNPPQHGPTVLLSREDADEWMLALALTNAPTTVLRFGLDAGTY